MPPSGAGVWWCVLRASTDGILDRASEVDIKVKDGAVGVRGSHFSQRTREMGHPFLDSVRAVVKIKIKVKGKSRFLAVLAPVRGCEGLGNDKVERSGHLSQR